MNIQNQTIEIWDNVNPLERQEVTIPVRKGQKILCHEPYVLEMMKMYDVYCPDDALTSISTYESGTYRGIREGVVSDFNEQKETATIFLSPKHSVHVDINTKVDSVVVGNKIDVVVTRKNGQVTADASSKAAQMERLKQELIKQIQTPTAAYGGVIKEVVYNGQSSFNGFIVDVSGLKCFMPGTESDVVPLNDFNALVGETLYVMPVAVAKDSIVVSHKEFLNTLKPATLERLANTPKGNVVTGVVSSVKHFGVFILIDKCVPTLLSASEMNDETEANFKNGSIKVGDEISFYIDNISGDRVTVTQTVIKSEGWEKLKETVDTNENYVLKGVVKNIFENGVVVISEEFNGITFFLSSKIINIEVLTVGQNIDLPVESIDTMKKTVRLRIPENNEE